MKKKHIVWISGIGVICLFLIIFLPCYFCIPRISYQYDAFTDSYYVAEVFGNAREYQIQDYVDSKPVTKIKSRAFMNKTNVEFVSLGKNINEIERLAFLNCKKLQRIQLDGVEVLGRNAFENCISLEEVALNVLELSGGVFLGCNRLSVVELGNTRSIGSYAFTGTAIEQITIPASCTSVGENAFYNCHDLKKILVLSKSLKNNFYLKSLDCVEFSE